jgi:flagellar assembly protein FliH
MSTIIKASQVHGAAGGPSFSYEDMTARAQDYLEQIRRQAEQMLEQARREAAAIRDRAENLGQSAALEAAKAACQEQVSRELTTLLPALRDAIDHIDAARAGWLAHWEKTAVHVAAAMAARVIRRELTRQPGVTLALVREALELASGSGELTLRMHPADFAVLGDDAERLARELSRFGKARVVADPEISPGGCRVDTRYGVIDQQFEAQLARIEQELA